ncbi:glycosyltransferase family 4 protein [Flavobacterium sp. CYK-4]|uniref:glycosyltransferase family 4 protein n=1 Tax=Flavobacterium lotistagni TaxID=2709660 RepID=UPI00140E24B1|nr:glycosyltransferase family 4 protein [Flavobacterium lotistagni]NHM05883.1 glycosyltransferase family 4 protein [Flavobacterium lotistagni]
MPDSSLVNFIDLSVYNRNITSVGQEIDLTPHSLGYLPFLDKNIEVAIIRFGNASETVGAYRLYRYRFNDLIQLLRFLNSRKPAVVLFHGFSFPFRFLLFKLLLGKQFKWMVQHHAGNPSKNKLKSFIQRLAYSQADGYLFVNRAQAQPFIQKKIISTTDSVFEIMECSTSFVLSDKTAARKTLGLSADKTIFIWVGNLDSNKDPLCLLEAFRLFRNQGHDFELYLFYSKTDLLSQVETFITQNQLEFVVFLKGKIDNPKLEPWYNAADFFVACSHSEGSGLAMAEAMACGCVPIVTNIPSFLYMTQAGAVGKMFNTGSPTDLTQKLVESARIELEPERMKTREVFMERLSFQAIGKKTSQAIHQLHSDLKYSS